jgi:hypothetical protein
MRKPRAEISPPPARVVILPRLCAGAIACLGWTALGIELYFVVVGASAKNETIAAALVRFFSFFTIQTHLLLALVLTIAAVRPDASGFLGRSGIKAAAVGYVAVVGAVYAVLLRHLYHWQGVMLLADSLLHDIVPVLYPLYWLAFVPKGGVRWADAFAWLVFPVAYFVYTLIRGALTGAYPYPFFNVLKLGYGQVTLNALGLLALFLAVGLAVAAIDRALSAQKGRGSRELGSAADF